MTGGGIVLGSADTIGCHCPSRMLGLPVEYDMRGRCRRMTGREFFDTINADDRFEWMGVREAEVKFLLSGKMVTVLPDRALVRPIGSGVVFEIDVSSILNTTWGDMEDVLTFKRAIQIMDHMTRIVGYYSRVRNWNRSAIAQLRDRRNGDYAITGRNLHETGMPKEITDILAAGRSGDMVCDIDKRAAS